MDMIGRRFYAVSSRLRKISNCKMEPLRPCSSKMDSHDTIQQRGALVVLEGLDRSGKSSQASKLVPYLQGLGVSSELWRFPDRSTTVGSLISSYLTNNSQLDDQTIHLLFSGNRWEKRSLMEEKLKCGTTLIVDRYSYSRVVFSSAIGLSHDWCKVKLFIILLSYHHLTGVRHQKWDFLLQIWFCTLK